MAEENARLTAQLKQARKAVDEKTAQVSEREDEVDALRRDMSETLTRAVAEAVRASLLSAEECKQQVAAMAERLKAELEAIKRNNRERGHEQLNRLLDELGVMSQHVTTLEVKIAENERMHAEAQESMAKLKALEAWIARYARSSTKRCPSCN